MSEHKDRIEHTLEVLVYAPIGVGLYLKDMGPTFVNMFVARGRAEIDRRQAQVQQRTTTARSIGQVAVTFGVPMVRQRVEKEVDSARQRAQSFLGTIGVSDEGSGPAPGAVGSQAPTAATNGASASPTNATSGSGTAVPVEAPAAAGNGIADESAGADASLPIPGYDALSASQVVQRLTGLAPQELDAVRTYESSHRKRRTILGKIDQISA